MRIVQLLPELNEGGVERGVVELNRELASLVPSAHPALLSVDQEGGRVQRVHKTL